MDDLIKILQIILPVVVIFGKMVFDNRKKREKEIEREKKENEAQAERDAKQDAREIENKRQIEIIAKSVENIKSTIDLQIFERKFVRKFKHENKNFINSLSIDDSLKLFCKTGVSQLSIIFKTILDSKFEITTEEIQDEIAEAKIFMSSQFKGNHPEYKEYIPNVKSEVMQFLMYLEDVKKLENGARMTEFEKLCKKTSIAIISNIAKK